MVTTMKIPQLNNKGFCYFADSVINFQQFLITKFINLFNFQFMWSELPGQTEKYLKINVTETLWTALKADILETTFSLTEIAICFPII